MHGTRATYFAEFAFVPHAKHTQPGTMSKRAKMEDSTITMDEVDGCSAKELFGQGAAPRDAVVHFSRPKVEFNAISLFRAAPPPSECVRVWC